MPLVDYPDSDENDSIEPNSALSKPLTTKRKRSDVDLSSELPPLPASFYDLYATNARTSTSDNPSLHAGRRRQIPHVEGNWPSHVYLEWHPSPENIETLHSLVLRLSGKSSKVHTLLLSDLDAPLPLHISLSRSLVLQKHQHDAFLSRVRGSIKNKALKPFHTRFSTVAWYPNHERSRWFLSLCVQRPEKDELNELLASCNAAASAMGQHELYTTGQKETGNRDGSEDRKRRKSQPEIVDCSSSFHISLAWSLETQKLSDGSEEIIPEQLKDLSATFDAVKVKIGNTITSLPLASKLDGVKRGLF